MASEETTDRVIAFLGAPDWEIWRKISKDDTLRRTLGVDGGRGHSILKAFATKFGVEMSEYRRRRYFTSYPITTWGPFPPEFTWLFRFVNPSFRHAWHCAVYYEISVEHLANVVEAGEWFDPEPIPFPDRPRLSSPRFDRHAIIVLNVLLIPYRLLGVRRLSVLDAWSNPVDDAGANRSAWLVGGIRSRVPAFLFDSHGDENRCDNPGAPWRRYCAHATPAPSNSCATGSRDG